MNEITRRAIQMHCSNLKTSYPSIGHIEEGVEIIEEILKKNILCRHDVERINRLYQTIDRLERKIGKIPECNSQTVLNKIIQKIKKIAQEKYICSNDLISICQLKHFSGENLGIENYFSSALKNFDKNPEACKTLAALLPCCHSEEQFKEDATSLFGQTPSQDISKILQRKREQIQHRTCIEQMSQVRKSELKFSDQKYPSYYDELLDNGYVHLYDHLVFMGKLSDRKTGRREIEKMRFSSISYVVLETREAIIQKVKSAIPENQKNILFLLGNTRSGKSTTFCLLRGDKLELKVSNYESKNDVDHLISSNEAISCTFLPSIEFVNDWAIVDFPGFDDTHGELVSLGIECALKALVKKYRSRVLVLEPITDNQDGFKSAGDLGERLNRLFFNPESCILGITKYTKDPNYKDLKTIEEKKETELSTEIKTLSNVNMPSLQQAIDIKRQELAKLQEEKALIQHLPLPDSDEKASHIKQIEERENNFLKQIGLKCFIPFSNLENPLLISSCFETFDNERPVFVSYYNKLDSHDEKLLTEIFTNNLVNEMKTQIDLSMDFKEFEQRVMESSLISTVFTYSDPQIGMFLHLPEMDPAIVRKYDNIIVSDCIKKYMEYVIHTLDMPLITILLETFKKEAPKEKITELQFKLKKVQDYIFGLLGMEHKDSKQAEEKWKAIRNNLEIAINTIEEDYKLPAWTRILMGIPLGIPLAIHTLLKLNAKASVKKQSVLELIQNCSRDLDQVHDTLTRLKDIENLIGKQDIMNKAFALRISTKSIYELHSSILNRIHEMRSIYGAENWDSRVAILANQFVLSPFDPKDLVYVSCLLAFAYIFIEPGLDYGLDGGPYVLGWGGCTSISIRNKSEKVRYYYPEGQYTIRNHAWRGLEGDPHEMLSKVGKISIGNGSFIIDSNFHHIPVLMNFETLINNKFPVINCALAAAALLKANGNLTTQFLNEKDFFSHLNPDERIRYEIL